MIKDPVKLTGTLQIHKNGELVHEVPNLVVTVGKEFVASRMVGVAQNVMSHMAIGTSSTAAAAGNVALGAENARVALDSSGAAGAVVTYAATFPAGTGTGTITEAGIFNASSSGVLLCRTVFSAISKGASDSLTITWTVTVS